MCKPENTGVAPGLASLWRDLWDGARPDFTPEFWQLVRGVEKYRTSRDGRRERIERIAVGVSLPFYCAGCWLLATGDLLPRACAIPLLIVTLVCWALAGICAEEDPPAKGKADIERAINSYKPVAATAYVGLLGKMTQGNWAMKDLAAFMRTEAAANLACRSGPQP